MPPYIKKPIFTTTQQDLSAAVLSSTYTMLKDGFFYWAGFKADGNITETATVEFISVDGSAYNIAFDTTNISADNSYLYNPTKPIFLRKGDGVKITCSKATATETVSSTIVCQERESHE